VHAWHHPKNVLIDTIRDGGAKLGGVMPAFKDRLTDDEIETLIAFFQSKWPDDVYQKWVERFVTGKASSVSPILVDSIKTLPASQRKVWGLV
jgi:hypothetical protein